MDFIPFVLIVLLVDKVKSTVMRDLSNPRPPVHDNLGEEIVESNLNRGFPAPPRYSNEDSQATAFDQKFQSMPPSLNGQYLYKQNAYEHPYQQMPQKEAVKKNTQNIQEQISPNAYYRPVQEFPEHFLQHHNQRAPGFPQHSQQWPLQGNTEHTVQRLLEPELSNEGHQGPTNKQVSDRLQQQINKLLQNIYKKPEQDIYQSSFQHDSNQDNYHNLHNNLEGRYPGEHVSQDSAGVLYPPNLNQRHVIQQNEEQEGFQRPHMYYPPPYNTQSFYGPKAAEFPVQEQPQSTRRIQTGEITVVKVPSDSSPT